MPKPLDVPADRADYFAIRAIKPCKECGTRRKVDMVSVLCRSCWAKYRSHGSPSVPKPRLERELIASRQIVASVPLEPATSIFDKWLKSYASPHTKDDLKRLLWLNYFELKQANGLPLMTLKDAVVQSLAVTIYDKRGGQFDDERKQFQYCLGRAVTSVWAGKRKVARGNNYDYSERRLLQFKPNLHKRAFSEIYLNAGVARLIAKITTQRKI